MTIEVGEIEKVFADILDEQLAPVIETLVPAFDELLTSEKTKKTWSETEREVKRDVVLCYIAARMLERIFERGDKASVASTLLMMVLIIKRHLVLRDMLSDPDLFGPDEVKH